MKEDLIFSENEGILTARITCDIDHHTAKPMRESIDRLLFERKPSALVIDFSQVVFMDSSGLGLIIGRADKAAALGISVQVIGLSPSLLKLVRLCGIEKINNLSVTR